VLPVQAVKLQTRSLGCLGLKLGRRVVEPAATTFSRPCAGGCVEASVHHGALDVVATGNAYQLRMRVGRGLLRHAEEEGQHVVVRPVRTSEHPGRHDGRSLRGMFLGGYCLCNILLVLLLVSLRCCCCFFSAAGVLYYRRGLLFLSGCCLDISRYPCAFNHGCGLHRICRLSLPPPSFFLFRSLN